MVRYPSQLVKPSATNSALKSLAVTGESESYVDPNILYNYLSFLWLPL